MAATVCRILVRGFICIAVFASAASAAAQSISLPGTIQVEDFDQGASEVAYHDTSSGNFGGEYRGTDVDIEACDEGGFDVGWVRPGEWLRYTVNVAVTGAHTVEFRVASRHSGGTFHLEVNGVDKTGPINVPDTGAWQTWTTVTKSAVTLSAGSQVWRLVFDDAGTGTGGDIGNFNYIRVSRDSTSAGSTPYRGTPAALPGTLEAEDFDNGGEGTAYHDLTAANSGSTYRSTGVDIGPTTDAGGGYNLGWVSASEWLTYSVNVATAGTYDLEVRVSSIGPGGTFHIEIDGVDRTGAFTVPNTGSWESWVTIRKTGLSLAAGQQRWRLVMDTNSATTGWVGNFNYIRVVTSGGTSSDGSSTSSSGSSTTPTTLVFTASVDDATLVTSYSVALYRSSDPSTVSPVATKNLGKPAPVGGDITQSISDIVNPLPSGSYYAVVTAIGSGGSSRSSPSGSFTK